MPIFKSTHTLLVWAASVTALYAFSSLHAVSNDNNEKTQLMALQSKVQVLEKELQELKSSINQASRNESRSSAQDTKVVISALDRLTLKAGKSTLQLSKDGTIILSGTRFDVKTTQNVDLRGSQIEDN